MSTYRERRAARADRLRGWADNREQKAADAFKTADDRAGMIPFGQPILVGHHSEGRDRRFRASIGAAMDRGVEHARKAEEMTRKAANIDAAAAQAIYRDDPDAIERLAEKLARLEAERERIKAYNASCRKGARDLSVLDDQQRADLASVARVASFQLGKNGEFPRYALTNLGGTISTTRKRLAEALDKRAAEAGEPVHVVEVFGLIRPGDFYVVTATRLAELREADTDFVEVLHTATPPVPRPEPSQLCTECGGGPFFVVATRRWPTLCLGCSDDRSRHVDGWTPANSTD